MKKAKPSRDDDQKIMRWPVDSKGLRILRRSKGKTLAVSIASLEADTLFANNFFGHELIPFVEFPFGHSTGPTFHLSGNLIRHADDELTTRLMFRLVNGDNDKGALQQPSLLIRPAPPLRAAGALSSVHRRRRGYK